MSLLDDWRDKAYNVDQNSKEATRLWKSYFEKEKEIYIDLLTDVSKTVEGTVEGLAEQYGTDVMTMTGFLDGINDSLKKPNALEKLKEKSKVKIDIDPEKLYKNMIAAKADWLYNLPQWDSIISEDRRKELAKEQRMSGTVIKDKKIGRNDPCPCGSGKKYKQCCMKK